jgi:uncharacterized DUF497 family protein
MTKPLFEFDPDKNKLNQGRHGIDFIEAQKLWDVPHVVIPAKDSKGESRYFAIGELEQKVYVAVFTERGGNVRLISCHRADERFERIYRGHGHEEIPQS